MRQPPESVPRAIAAWAERTIQSGMWNDLDPAGGEDQAGDDAHRLLGVVAAVAQAVEGRREELEPAGRLVDPGRVLLADDPGRGRDEEDAEDHAEERGDEDEHDRLDPAVGDDDPRARLDDGRPGVAADEGVGGARRQAHEPGEEVPADGPEEGGEDDLGGHDRDVDHPRADRVGDARAEDEEGDEIEEGGPEDGLARRQDPGRDDGGDGVGRVVHAVREVERQRDEDDEDDEEEAGVGHEA